MKRTIFTINNPISLFLLYLLFLGHPSCKAQKPIIIHEEQINLFFSDYNDNCLTGFVVLKQDSLIFFQEILTVYDSDNSSEWDTIRILSIDNKDTLNKYSCLTQKIMNDSVYYGDDNNLVCSGGFDPYLIMSIEKGESKEVKEWIYFKNAVFSPSFMEFSNFIWRNVRSHRRASCIHVKW